MKTKFFPDPFEARFEVQDAKKNVSLQRTAKHIRDGVAGNGMACMDNQCALSAAISKEQAKVFLPHKVIATWQKHVTVMWALALRKNGSMYGVRYMRPIEDQKDIKFFDQNRNHMTTEKLITFVKPRVIRFLAPIGAKKLGNHESGPSGDTGPKRSRVSKNLRKRGSDLRFANVTLGALYAAARKESV